MCSGRRLWQRKRLHAALQATYNWSGRSIMHRKYARAFARAVAVTVLILGAAHFATPASAQSGEGWITLLDGKTMGDWNQVGETNWRLEDGAVVADKRTSKETAHLVSKNSY